MKQADRIRAFVIDNVALPARAAGEAIVVVKAADVHRDMGLANAFPAVCSALRGVRLQHEAGLVLLGSEGPSNGANVWFKFSVSPEVQGRAQDVSTTPSRLPSPPSEPLNFRQALAIVSCSKTKLLHQAPARELYCSTAFRMKRDLLETNSAAWIILSAQHGVVDPLYLLEPYDLTLTSMNIGARQDWARRVLPALIPLAAQYGRIISFAGERYVEHLRAPLSASGVVVAEPLKGLRQGEQLAWLSGHQ